MNKVYPNRINWENLPSEETPINETNLNKMDYALYELDDRLIAQDETKANKIEVAPLVANVEFDETTGIFTFTKKDGSTFTLDTLLEKVIVNFSFDRDTQKIILIMEDGTQEEIDLSAFIAEYEFSDSDTIAFTLLENHKITAKVKEGSITEDYLQPNYLADIKVVQAKAEAAQEAAETAQGNAEDFAKEAEAHAVGQRGGVDVGTDDPTYHNNAKFYAEKSASDGEAWAKGTRGGVPVPSTDETYQNSAEYWAKQASLQKNTYFGTCTGQAANQNKAVTISDDQNFALKIGTVIGVKFDTNNTYSATAAAPVTLNVNSTGAKQIYASNTATPTGTNTTYFGRANYINYYMYDGAYWAWAGSSSDNNTTYTPQALGTGYGTCTTAEATTEKAVSLSGYALVRNGIVSVKFTNAVPANATMNINSRGAKNIFFQGTRITADIIKAGDIATFIYDGTQYQLISIDSGTGSGSFTYTEIEYEDFLNLTEEEQQTGNYIVLNWGGDTPSGGGGGHTIQDQYGNILMQRNTLQFTGNVEISDDAENKRTIIHIPTIESSFTYEMRRLIFRGKYLGDSFTAKQKEAIQSGTFDDLWLGDYWIINGITWRIVDIDYWLNTGDTALTAHHLVVMPDHVLYSAQMNTSNTTAGGYVGSEMYKTGLDNAKTAFTNAFGSENIISHRELLSNAVTNGYPSSGAWYNSTVELPNEIMMYGSYVHTPSGNGSIVPYIYTIDKTQLALMRHDPKWINPYRENQWLRDVVSDSVFAFANDNGYTAYGHASSSFGVRPIAAVG